jgi:hypothetical protein
MERETMKIRLEPVTVASRAAVERLETAPGQEGFVESVAECLAEAGRQHRHRECRGERFAVHTIHPFCQTVESLFYTL